VIVIEDARTDFMSAHATGLQFVYANIMIGTIMKPRVKRAMTRKDFNHGFTNIQLTCKIKKYRGVNNQMCGERSVDVTVHELGCRRVSSCGDETATQGGTAAVAVLGRWVHRYSNFFFDVAVRCAY